MVRSLPVRGWKEPPGQNMSGPAAVASLTAWHVLSRIVIYCHKIITHQHSHFVPLHRIFRARGFILSRLRATATRHQPSKPQRLISHRDGPHVIPVSPWHHLLTLTTEYYHQEARVSGSDLYYVWTFNNTLTKRLMAAINRRQSSYCESNNLRVCSAHYVYIPDNGRDYAPRSIYANVRLSNFTNVGPHSDPDNENILFRRFGKCTVQS